MDDKARSFMKKLARLANDIETDDIIEHVEKKASSFESVAIVITEPFSLITLINFSEINGNPIGFERLSESGYVEISWDRRSGTRLSNEDFKCLKLYYERQYADPVSVLNYVEKFKQISVLGYVYKSKLCGDDTMLAFNAYRCNDTDSDDLDGVDMDHYEEHLRAGEVQYFFRHKVQFVSKYGSNEELDHYFAFVEWFKSPRKGKETHDKLTDDFMRPFREENEKKGSYSIMPVQKFHTPIHLQKTPFTNIIVTADFPRRII
ncbi:hypothetical protein EDC96DRAFT_591179 [Choanephora cucurbitarum]|nr:hypothetical protein EDC96DRAFT_591179 [Choanephora cucurbitarum]